MNEPKNYYLEARASGIEKEAERQKDVNVGSAAIAAAAVDLVVEGDFW
ncbi:MAG TPA: hypothetical protein VJT81_05715 [Burkholderiales bacterium]|nr:hypothetical protein [Burkholderiales bacterium]